MTNELSNIDLLSQEGEASSHSSRRIDPRIATSEALAGVFRQYLRENGAGNWPIFSAPHNDLREIDWYLKALDSEARQWELLPVITPDGEQPRVLTTDKKMLLKPGVLRLPKYDLFIARWYYRDFNKGDWRSVYLYAAPGSWNFHNLRDDLNRLLRGKDKATWTIITGEGWGERELPIDETATWTDLVIDPVLRQRLETEVLSFFDDPVAELYRDMKMPYRRGVLMYGPPGNGKTSLIRVLAAQKPKIPGLILRPGSDFDCDSFQNVIDSWQEKAPAILVIEDLDSLFRQMSVSSFLNQIDGFERRKDGLLLIGTTNYPERLDPAINSRPGRFDVVLEVPNPRRALRLEFLQKAKLPGVSETAIATTAAESQGFSFAQLREIEHLSGLLALRNKRMCRNDKDLIEAVGTIRQTHDMARRGFPDPVTPFGLCHSQVED